MTRKPRPIIAIDIGWYLTGGGQRGDGAGIPQSPSPVLSALVERVSSAATLRTELACNLRQETTSQDESQSLSRVDAAQALARLP
jgi:hypothetical protein